MCVDVNVVVKDLLDGCEEVVVVGFFYYVVVCVGMEGVFGIDDFIVY